MSHTWGVKTNAYTVLVGKPLGKRPHFGELDIDGTTKSVKHI
jgi:hypothetical protein